VGSGLNQALFNDIDNEQLARIRTHAAPLAIPEWDGWRYPSTQEVARLHLILDAAEDRSSAPRNRNNVPEHRQGWEAPAWLLVGQPEINAYLLHRPAAIAQPYANSHPVVLPPSSNALLAPPPSSTVIDEDTPMAKIPSGNTHPANAGVASSLDLNIGSINPANAGVDAPMDYQADNLPKSLGHALYLTVGGLYPPYTA